MDLVKSTYEVRTAKRSVQVVQLNWGSELGGPHNFTEIILYIQNISKIKTVHLSVYTS